MRADHVGDHDNDRRVSSRKSTGERRKGPIGGSHSLPGRSANIRPTSAKLLLCRAQGATQQIEQSRVLLADRFIRRGRRRGVAQATAATSLTCDKLIDGRQLRHSSWPRFCFPPREPTINALSRPFDERSKERLATDYRDGARESNVRARHSSVLMMDKHDDSDQTCDRRAHIARSLSTRQHILNILTRHEI